MTPMTFGGANHFALLRYDVDGSPDATFGGFNVARHLGFTLTCPASAAAGCRNV